LINAGVTVYKAVCIYRYRYFTNVFVFVSLSKEKIRDMDLMACYTNECLLWSFHWHSYRLLLQMSRRIFQSFFLVFFVVGFFPWQYGIKIITILNTSTLCETTALKGVSAGCMDMGRIKYLFPFYKNTNINRTFQRLLTITVWLVGFVVLSATFNNISAISWLKVWWW